MDSSKAFLYRVASQIFHSFKFFKIVFIDFREEEGKERKKDIDLLFHLFMQSLVDFYMCPDWGLNSQPWHSRTTL